jgi:hypothetical protein
MADEGLMWQFRRERCNIVGFRADKSPIIPKGSKVLRGLQSDREFRGMLGADRWGVTPTASSSIVLVDLDEGDYPRLAGLFTRSRQTYRGGKMMTSRHGVLKVTDAPHDWCVEFAGRHHIPGGLELFAESQHMAISGRYDCKRRGDLAAGEAMPTSAWGGDGPAIVEVTRRELGRLFAARVPAGKNMRHSALISLSFEILQGLRDGGRDTDPQSLYRMVMESGGIENMGEYADGPKRAELLDIVKWVLANGDSEKSLAGAYVKMQENSHAHILDDNTKEQFNCWTWLGDRWTDNTAYHILEALVPLTSEGFQPTSGLATGMSNVISATGGTLMVRLDDAKYNETLMGIVTNGHGQYFDLGDRTINDVDPAVLFFKYPQFSARFAEAEEPMHFIGFVEERFPDREDQQVFYDHLAGTFLHTSVLRSKPKMLFVCGLHDSFKSLIIEVMKSILSTHSVSNNTVEQTADKWGKSMLMDKMFNYSEEQRVAEPRDPANLKDVITAESGYVQVKYKPKPVFAARFPRHCIMCNKLSPIGRDDDDDSIFIRNQYLRIEKVDPKCDWRELLLEGAEVQRIAMFLLNRASDIFNRKRRIHVQSLRESKRRYRSMTTSDFNKFVRENFMTGGVTEDIGTSFNWILARWNGTMPDSITNGALTQKFEDAGHEKKVRNWMYRTGEHNVFTEIDPENGSGKTQQTVIMGLKPTMRTVSAVPGTG